MCNTDVMGSITPPEKCEDLAATPAPLAVSKSVEAAVSIDAEMNSRSELASVADDELDSPIENKQTVHVPAELAPVDMAIKKHALTLAIDALDEDGELLHVEWLMFNIFNEFLQPNTQLSVGEAAKCLDAILPDNRPDKTDDPENERERAENWLWMFADMIWNLVKQIPHDHESQDKILYLFEALDRLPFTQTFEEKHFWASKLFGWEDPSRWAITDTRPRHQPKLGKTRQQECDVYVNAMAFAARCAAIHWPHYDLVVFILDEPLSPDYVTKTCDGLEPEFMYVHVAAAAQWVLHAGEWLWGQIRWGQNQTLSHTKRSLPPAQWVTWMRGYYKMESSNEAMRFWADVLARKMEGIMLEHGYTAEVMLAWDPKKQTVHDDIWADSRYAHLFKIPITSESKADQ